MGKRAAVTVNTAAPLEARSEYGYGTIPGLPIVGDEFVAHAEDEPRLNIQLELLEDTEVFIWLGRLLAFLDLDGIHLIPLNDQQVDLLLVYVAVVEQVSGLTCVVVALDDLRDHISLKERSVHRTVLQCFRSGPAAEIGGKTGTSEKVSLEAQTGQKEYIVSFIGFAPADEPRIALLVFLDTPSNKSGIYISGGQMAAPVVGRMMADILPYMGVKAESGEENGEAVMPMTVGKSLGEAAEMLGDAGLRYRTIGGGITVTQQLPAAGSSIAAGSQVILYLDAEISQDTETVPDLTGMTYNQARDTLSYYGIYISTRSNVTDSAAQTVSGQSLPAGTGVDHGCIIEVSLIDQDDSILGRY